ncbi:ImmA/IrrE family metallo-endopeptidase [Rossellomorea sp. BNER]|uniref:ImmA/IrrE family metallo-endopeptidase n=1 Tax=Rossellomorea sp. BNER TaxID=2962031 RepID=UPI003AF26847|nr:ImmA/IrrE family metallo-endopeptidase [Rossellomorea sp. BNER]
MYQLTYRTTGLEDWVSMLYVKLGINCPSQINEEKISRYFEIYVKKKPMHSSFHIIGRYKDIVIDSREPVEKHREIFFHELCHILRHSGIQTIMPSAFRELQEWDANHFTQYAAIPYHMIKYIPFNDMDIIKQMTEMFKVSPELCEERLKQIYRRNQVHIQQSKVYL